VIGVVTPKERCSSRGPVGSPAPTRVARALAEPRAPTWLGAGKGDGRGAEGVGPSHREQGNGQHGKGFCAKTITAAGRRPAECLPSANGR
jgi:hypothetical protein